MALMVFNPTERALGTPQCGRHRLSLLCGQQVRGEVLSCDSGLSFLLMVGVVWETCLDLPD